MGTYADSDYFRHADTDSKAIEIERKQIVDGLLTCYEAEPNSARPRDYVLRSRRAELARSGVLLPVQTTIARKQPAPTTNGQPVYLRTCRQCSREWSGPKRFDFCSHACRCAHEATAAKEAHR